MPVMDGYAATRAIREYEAQRELPPVPIVALTAHALAEHKKRARQAGMDEQLDKPVRLEALSTLFSRFLGASG